MKDIFSNFIRLVMLILNKWLNVDFLCVKCQILLHGGLVVNVPVIIFLFFIRTDIKPQSRLWMFKTVDLVIYGTQRYLKTSVSVTNFNLFLKFYPFLTIILNFFSIKFHTKQFHLMNNNYEWICTIDNFQTMIPGTHIGVPGPGIMPTPGPLRTYYPVPAGPSASLGGPGIRPRLLPLCESLIDNLCLAWSVDVFTCTSAVINLL